MLKAFRYRINPTEEQKILLNKHFGCARMVFNLGLETKQMAYAGAKVNLRCFDLINQLGDLKEVAPYLKEVNSQCLQMALRNLDNAFTAFFKGNAKFPNFKKKGNRDSFHCPQNVEIEYDKIFLPKFKTGIDIVLHRTFKGKIKTVTISKTPTNKYFASVLCDTNDKIPKPKTIKENTTVGIDLGIKDFVVCSDGQKFSNPKYLNESSIHLKWLQKQLSRKKKGSNRRKVWRFRVAKCHEKISNQRKDFLHKVSDAITKQYDTVVMENLQVANMMKNHCLARSISDAGWNMFEQFVKYKAVWRGKNVLQIGTFEPSSKTCSHCGAINKSLTLDQREWTCICGTKHDRDMNAAINIKTFGLRKWRAGRSCQDMELPSLGGALKCQSSFASSGVLEAPTL